VFYEVFNDRVLMEAWAKYKPPCKPGSTSFVASHPRTSLLRAAPPGTRHGRCGHQSNHRRQHHLFGHMYYQHYNKGRWKCYSGEQCREGRPLIMTEWGYCGSCQTSQDWYGHQQHLWNFDVELAGRHGRELDCLVRIKQLASGYVQWAQLDAQDSQDEMGAFVKDWMYTKKDQNSVN